MPTVSLATLESRVWDLLDDNQLEFPEIEVRSILNEGLARLNCLVGFAQDTLSVPGFSVANQLLYTVPTGIMIPIRVYFEAYELKRFSLRRLARKYQQWAVETTATAGPVVHWAPIGLQQFVLHPIDAVGGQLVEVSGITSVTALVNPGDVLDLEDNWVDCLILYARSRALLKEGGKSFQDSLAAYQKAAKQIRSQVVWRSMIWPEQWLARQQEVGAGKGT